MGCVDKDSSRRKNGNWKQKKNEYIEVWVELRGCER